jgi:hypothetical protein
MSCPRSVVDDLIAQPFDPDSAKECHLRPHVLHVAAGADQGDPDYGTPAAACQLARDPQRHLGARHHRYLSASRRLHHQAADDFARRLV